MNVYVLIDPRTEEIRYVGISAVSVMRRYRAHTDTRYQVGHKTSWIKSIQADGFQPELKVIETCSTKEELQLAEVWWIRHLRSTGHRLLNLTDGGEGMSGYAAPRSEEWRRKIGDAHRGKTISPELRAIFSAQQRGKKRSPETIAKIKAAAASRSGQKRSPDVALKAWLTRNYNTATRNSWVLPVLERSH